jgi:hypothetical protein
MSPADVVLWSMFGEVVLISFSFILFHVSVSIRRLTFSPIASPDTDTDSVKFHKALHKMVQEGMGSQ